MARSIITIQLDVEHANLSPIELEAAAMKLDFVDFPATGMSMMKNGETVATVKKVTATFSP